MSAQFILRTTLMGIIFLSGASSVEARDGLAPIDVPRSQTQVGPPRHRLATPPAGPRATQPLPPRAPKDVVGEGPGRERRGDRLEQRVRREFEQVQARFDTLVAAPELKAGDPTVDRANARLSQAAQAVELGDWPVAKRSVDAARALITVVEKAELPTDVDLKDDAFAHLERAQALSERAARRSTGNDVVVEEARMCRDRGVAEIGNENWEAARRALVHAEGLFRLALRHGDVGRPPRRPGQKPRRRAGGEGAVHPPLPPPVDAAEAIGRLDALIADHGEATSERTAELLAKVIEQRDLAREELDGGQEKEALRRASRGLRLGLRLSEERPPADPRRAAEAVGRLDELVSVAQERTADLADDAPEHELLTLAEGSLGEARDFLESGDPRAALEAAHVGHDLVFEILGRTRPAIR